MSKSPPLEFAPETSGMDMIKLPNGHPESQVRSLTYSGVEEFKRSLKTQDNIEILREALRRELEGGAPRVSMTKPLRAKINKIKATAEVEVIELNDTLDDCSDGITAASQRLETEFARYDRATKYDRVAIGLWLLKAKHLHLRPTVGRRDKNSGKLTAASGFQEWLASESPHIKQSTAYNYINAAQNAGLTLESSEKDITALKKSKALDAVPIKQLYASIEQIEDQQDPEPEQEQPSFTIMRTALNSFRDESNQLLKLKDDMTPEVYETVIARAQRTLEQLTGDKWGPVPDDKAATYKEHPEAYALGS